MARPKMSKYDIPTVIRKAKEYLENTELPIVKELCLLNDWNYKYIKDLEAQSEELSDTMKKIVYKKEVELERGGLVGKYVPAMVIFSLKQLGWKEKNEGETDKIINSGLKEITDAIRSNRDGV